MKTFEFRLEKALDWRRLQMRLAEIALEKLNAELTRLLSQKEQLQRERDQAGRGLTASGKATGVELAFLDLFRKATDAEIARLESASADCRRNLDAQTAAVLERRREYKALEKLKAKQLALWQADFGRELDLQASESYLARWRPAS